MTFTVKIKTPDNITLTPETVKSTMNDLLGLLLHWTVYTDHATGISCQMTAANAFEITMQGVTTKDAQTNHFLVRVINRILNNKDFYIYGSAVTGTGFPLDVAKLTAPFNSITKNAQLLTKYNIEDEIPEEFQCAMCAQIMDDPVFAPDTPHIKWDREQINLWLFQQGIPKNPYTGKALSTDDLKSDEKLKNVINNFVKEKISKRIIPVEFGKSFSILSAPTPKLPNQLIVNMIDEKISLENLPPEVSLRLLSLKQTVDDTTAIRVESENSSIVICGQWLKFLNKKNPKAITEIADILLIPEPEFREMYHLSAVSTTSSTTTTFSTMK